MSSSLMGLSPSKPPPPPPNEGGVQEGEDTHPLSQPREQPPTPMSVDGQPKQPEPPSVGGESSDNSATMNIEVQAQHDVSTENINGHTGQDTMLGGDEKCTSSNSTGAPDTKGGSSTSPAKLDENDAGKDNGEAAGPSPNDVNTNEVLEVNADEDACADLLAFSKSQEQPKSATREQMGNINLPNADGGEMAGDKTKEDEEEMDIKPPAKPRGKTLLPMNEGVTQKNESEDGAATGEKVPPTEPSNDIAGETIETKDEVAEHESAGKKQTASVRPRGKVLPSPSSAVASNDITNDDAKKIPETNGSNSASSPRGKTLLPNSDSVAQLKDDTTSQSKDEEDTETKSDANETSVASAVTNAAMRLRGKTLPGMAKTVDENATISGKDEAKELSFEDLFTGISPGPRHDRSGNVIDCNQNDVFLSLKDPVYKAVMFDQFRRIGMRDSNDVAAQMFNRFKERGGRFFKCNRSTQYEQVDVKAALAKILRDIQGRNENAGQWRGQKSIIQSQSVQSNANTRKKRKAASYGTTPMTDVSVDNVIATTGRSGRKRSKPQSFADSQGQDFLVQDSLRESARAAKKKRKTRNSESAMKTFSINENRQFEQGCMRFGWGEWDDVQTLVPGRTAEECEAYAIQIEAQHPEVKVRLIQEHQEMWVWPVREGESNEQAKLPSKPPPPRHSEGGQSTVRKSGRAREISQKLKDNADDESKSTSPKPSKRTKAKGSKSKRQKAYDDDEAYTTASRKRSGKKSEDCTHESASAQVADDTSSRRPKRQSAAKAREMLSSINSDDGIIDDHSTGDSREVTSSSRVPKVAGSVKTKLKKEKKKLLKGLAAAPSNGEYYEEESAWRFHNPSFPRESVQQLTALRKDVIPHTPAPIPAKDLKPLPPAPPLPPLPQTGYCTWSFDEKTRVLLANFRDCKYSEGKKGKVKVYRADESFLFQMMERDDITVISEGLADSINSSFLTPEYIEGCIGQEYHHKFRSFETKSSEDANGSQPANHPTEKAGWYSMKVADYFRYLKQRQQVKSIGLDEPKENHGSLSKDFTFTDCQGEQKTVNVDTQSLYMIDVDLVKLLPGAFEDLQRNFKLPGILPGGSHCMMNAVNANGRPFMGPNLYITPPSAFTHFHQDGHGTVDSGHLCLSGYNEVVMLRRLTERHKCHAMQLLTGTSNPHSTLYGLPHRDDLECQVGWPSNEAIEHCRKMGYYPSVFVLKPGQVVHINKGRLHAFRKLAPAPLQETDCHYDLRNAIRNTKERLTEDICFSIAWDWMFKGVTSEGINREVSSVLECSRLNSGHDLQSLAIPETSLLFLAKESISKHQLSIKTETDVPPLFAMNIPDQSTRHVQPNAETVLRGILPSLAYVVNRHNSALKFSEKWEEKTASVKDSWRVSIDSKPNTWQDPSSFSLDPYGAGDFFCKFCSEELANVYMHCDGCEKLLDKDFNICSTCHMAGRYRVNHQMHPFNAKPHSILNHTGIRNYSRRSRCPCKNGKECTYCGFCTGCSCKCHMWFTLHYRFMGVGNELEMLEKAKSIVGDDLLSHTAETTARLLTLISEDLPQDEVVIASDAICQVIEPEPKERPPARAEAKKRKEPFLRDDAMPSKEESKPSSRARGNRVAEDLDKKSVNDAKPAKRERKVNESSTVEAATSLGKSLQRMPSNSTEGGVVSLEGAAATGCDKCHKEFKTGEKTKRSHSNHCPRRVLNRRTTVNSKSSEASLVAAATNYNAAAAVNETRVSTPPPSGRSQSAPAPDIGPGWTVVVTQRVNQSNAKADKSYVAPNGETFRSMAEVRRYLDGDSVSTGGSKVAKKSAEVAEETGVTFTCPKCSKEFSFASARAGPGAFAGHVKHCGNKKVRHSPRKSQKSVDLGVTYDEIDDEDDVSELTAGSKVIVRCEQGKDWQATILKRHERNGEAGYRIHYKGQKKKSKGSDMPWVPDTKIVGFPRDEEGSETDG